MVKRDVITVRHVCTTHSRFLDTSGNEPADQRRLLTFLLVALIIVLVSSPLTICCGCASLSRLWLVPTFQGVQSKIRSRLMFEYCLTAETTEPTL